MIAIIALLGTNVSAIFSAKLRHKRDQLNSASVFVYINWAKYT